MNKVKKILDKNSHLHYFKTGYGRILASAIEFDKISKIEDKVLDIGGTYEKHNKQQSFELIFKAVKDIDYHCVNRGMLDMRKDMLNYEDETFDIVMSHESIEHFWLMKEAGMVDWSGMINFWKESFRVLKKNGTFLVSTRNRMCPVAIEKLRKGKPLMCSHLKVNQSSHIQEMGPIDFIELVDATNLFTNYDMYSIKSIDNDFHHRIPQIEAFIGRKLLQEELYDTIYFKSKK